MHRFEENLKDLIGRVGRGNAESALHHHPDFTSEVREPSRFTNPENPKATCGCGRTTQADILVYYDGDYICDGCWTALRRAGVL